MERVVLRSLLLSGCFGLALPSFAQDLSRKVTLTAPAVRASVVLRDLSKQVGIPLTAAPKTADDVLILKVKDVTLKELLTQIATVTNGTWKESGEGYELVRATATEDQWSKTERAARADEIAKALAAANERVAKLPAFSQAEAERLADKQAKRIQEIDKRLSEGATTVRINGSAAGEAEESPSARAVLAVLSVVGANALATLPRNERVVFGLSANRAQQSLPGRAWEPIKNFVKEQQMVSAAAQAKQPDDGRKVMFVGTNGAELGPGNPNLGLGKAMLVVQRIADSLRAQLVVADTNGQTVVAGSYMLTVGPTSPSQVGKGESGKPISLSPLAAEFANAVKMAQPGAASGPGVSVAGRRSIVMISNGTPITFEGGDSGEKPIAMSAELRKRLLHPEEFDPQGLTAAEGVLAAAEARRENLVASLPDSAIMPMTRALGEGVDVDRLLGVVARASGVAVSEEQGWMVVSPAKPSTARANRIDRAALGKLLRALDTQSVARLGDLTDFALAQAKTVEQFDYDGRVMRLISSGGGSSAASALAQPDILRFYGSLTPGQRSALQAGNALQIANLSPSQKNYLWREVYQSQGGPSRRGQPGAVPAILTMRNGFEGERTELMPDGIPENGLVRLQMSQAPAALATDENGSTSVLTPNALASRMFQAERADLSIFGPVSKIQSYAPAAQTQVTLLFEFSPEAQMQRSLADTWIEKSQRVAYDGLPADMRSQTEAALAQIRSSLGGIQIKPPTIRGGTPPP